MISICSKFDNKLLHLVVRAIDFDEIKSERVNLGSEKDFLQVALLSIQDKKKFADHRHLERPVSYNLAKAQEAWFVITGEVQVIYFDENDIEIFKTILSMGDLSITYHGGHGYKTLTENVRVIEIKTGPYEGAKLDKVLI